MPPKEAPHVQQLFNQVNTTLLMFAAAAAVGVGVASHIHNLQFWWVIVLAFADLLINIYLVAGLYKMTVGRGSSASTVSATFGMWAFFSLAGIVLVAGAFLIITGQTP